MPRRRVLIAAALSVLAVAGCSGGHREVHASTPPPSPSRTSASPTPSPTPTVVPGAWLSGKAGPTGPVFAIKIDNAPSAWPLQHGLDSAQVVYQELVEGGTTRLVAMLVGASSTDVGPVRSGRDTDIDLLAQYGPIIMGFSGANSGVMADLRRSSLILVPQEYYGGAYTQRGRRVEAYNFFTTPARLAAAAPRKAADTRDVGFRFGDAPAGGSLVTASLVADFSTTSQDVISWDAARHGWHIVEGGSAKHGTDGAPVAPANVLVQYVPLVRGRYVDVDGNNSPDSETLGTGKAVLLRDGHRWEGTWVRSRADGPTRWFTADGHTLALQPGQTWVLLVPQTRPLRAG